MALLCKDLKPGDILLKLSDRSFFNKLVVAAQSAATEPNAFIAHAAVALDTQFCIEAQSTGISANHLAMKNKEYAYFVYRPVDPAIGRGAANAAKLLFDIHQCKRSLRYSAGGAIESLFGSRGNVKTAENMDAILEQILAGKGHPFFCSQFVVYVYQWVGQQNRPPQTFFAINDAKVPPCLLATKLSTHVKFTRVGCMVPNER
jgi:hypothetical protein